MAGEKQQQQYSSDGERMSSSSSSSSDDNEDQSMNVGGGGGHLADLDEEQEKLKREKKQNGKRGESNIMKESNVIQIRAYAILRTHAKDYHINDKEVILGRSGQEESKSLPVIEISDSKKVSRKACKIYFNE